MNFPGTSKLTLSDEAMKSAFEEALNVCRDHVDLPIRILSIHKPAYGDIELTITTDTEVPGADA